jgi:hypothetical protein
MMQSRFLTLAAALMLLAAAAPAQALDWTADAITTSGTPTASTNSTANLMGSGYPNWRGIDAASEVVSGQPATSGGGDIGVHRDYWKNDSQDSRVISLGGSVSVGATAGGSGNGSGYCDARAQAYGDSTDFPNTTSEHLDKSVTASYPSNPDPGSLSDNYGNYDPDHLTITLIANRTLDGSIYALTGGSSANGASASGGATATLSFTNP